MIALRKIYSFFGHNPGTLLLHFSFLLIIAGGLVTFFCREAGSIHLLPGQTSDTYVSEKDGLRHPLPQPVTLANFRVDHYPGGIIPRDYISLLAIGSDTITVSMNHIHKWEGFRLMQSGFDPEGGSIIAVSHDPIGTWLVYSGFIAFTVGGLLMMLKSGGRFCRLLGKSVLIFLFTLSLPIETRGEKVAGIPRETADSLGRREVVYNGSYVTFNTLARDVLTKVSGKPSYRGLTAEQVLLSFRLYPEVWKDIPIIRIKDKELAYYLGVTGKYAALSDLFDKEGNYRLTPLLEKDDSRIVAELDEKAGILLTLLSGQLIEPVPENAVHLPEWRITLELLYNRLPLSTLLFIILFCGTFLFLSAGLFGKRKEFVLTIGKVALCSAFSVGLLEFTLQWILAGRLPVSNTFETLEFAIVVVLAVILFGVKRTVDPESRRIMTGGGMLICATLAFVAHLVEMNPVITPLMPVLHSPWLSIHVSIIMTAYALFLMTAVNSACALLRPDESEELRRLSTLLLYPGVWFLGIGIATGSVWAAISWGHYWSWDPKETWALITLLVYVLPLHQRVFKKRRHKGNRAFHLYLLLAILTVAMTYFGVNFLNSRHAY